MPHLGVKVTLMSKGLGNIQRQLDAILSENPDSAFTIQELAERIYDTYTVEKRHRVALIRAAKGLLNVRPELGLTNGYRMALYHHRSLTSYATARLKGMGFVEDSIPANIGYQTYRMTEGGEWWLDVHEWIAEHDGDAELAARIKPFLEKRQREYEADLALYKSLCRERA